MKKRVLGIVDRAIDILEITIDGIEPTSSTAPADLLACIEALNIAWELYAKDTD